MARPHKSDDVVPEGGERCVPTGQPRNPWLRAKGLNPQLLNKLIDSAAELINLSQLANDGSWLTNDARFDRQQK